MLQDYVETVMEGLQTVANILAVKKVWLVLQHDSRNKVKHSWKISHASAGNWSRVAPVQEQCSNHWAKESTLWRSCQRLIIY